MRNGEEQRDAAGRTTLVEAGTAIKGTFASDCPIIVKGRIEGNITGPSLTVSATGAVAGTVKVGLIESEGELSGEFEADVVRLSGRVRDKTVIRAKSLEVKLAPEVGKMQVVFGECALEVGDMPSKEAVMASAQSQQEAKAPAAVEAPPSAGEPSVQAKAEAAPVVQAPEAEKPERRHGRGRPGPVARPSSMPPPPAGE